MSSADNRNVFSVQNKYQMQIISLIVYPLFIIFAILLVLGFFLLSQINKLAAFQAYTLMAPFLARWFLYFICAVFAVILLFVLVAFNTAHNLVNPFNRIIGEIDEFLITGEKRKITVRTDDELAQTVVGRINQLIEKIK